MGTGAEDVEARGLLTHEVTRSVACTTSMQLERSWWRKKVPAFMLVLGIIGLMSHNVLTRTPPVPVVSDATVTTEGELITTYDADTGPFACAGASAGLAPGTGDGTTWRCIGGACIGAAQKCDGIPQCRDSSDEQACSGSASAGNMPSVGVPATGSSSGVAPTGSSSSSSSSSSNSNLGGAWGSSTGNTNDYGGMSAGSNPAVAPPPAPAPAPVLPVPTPGPAPPGSSSSNSISFPKASSYQPPPPPESSGGTNCFEKAGVTYAEAWRAQGTGFWDKFDYMTNDENFMPIQYLTREAAQEKQVTVAYEDRAILRAGPRAGHLKRTSAKVVTKQKWTYFLMAAKLNHVPWGCGTWPAFWTRSPDVAWPNGGELDILEYANEIASRSSLHVGVANKCTLDQSEFRKPGCPQFIEAEFNYTGDSNCVTHYPEAIGCAPNHLPLMTGEEMAAQPIIMAAEWTKDFIKIFRIPAAQAPPDLEAGTPTPDQWDQFIVAYYPFAASERNNPGSCPNSANLLKAQQLVLQLGFCGDWGAKVWLNSTCANNKGPALPSECVAVDPHNPMGEQIAGPRDCCTRFITDEQNQYGADEYLRQNAYFDVAWIKVFQR
mmetsp:Transcript_21546/g.41133  ORF Transcript_21546/g.41133 Transcript_21546/m.41133 type:complete len:604 (-) Transcript_21546:174-1985(-)